MNQLSVTQKKVLDLCISQLKGLYQSNDIKSPSIPIEMEDEWKSLSEEIEIDHDVFDFAMHQLYIHITTLHDTNKQAWIKIKEEYEEGIKEYEFAWALCTTSETFKLAWNEELKHKAILKHAQKFLELRDEPDSTSDFLLFYCNESKSTEEEREIRLDFINYMIDNCNEEVQVNS